MVDQSLAIHINMAVGLQLETPPFAYSAGQVVIVSDVQEFVIKIGPGDAAGLRFANGLTAWRSNSNPTDDG